MTALEAIETAIEALGIEVVRLTNEARHGHRYSFDSQFNRDESQNLANIIARYEKAISQLQIMVTRIRETAE